MATQGGAAAAAGAGPRVRYACRACRTELLTEADVAPHGDVGGDGGLGSAAFK